MVVFSGSQSVSSMPSLSQNTMGILFPADLWHLGLVGVGSWPGLHLALRDPRTLGDVDFTIANPNLPKIVHLTKKDQNWYQKYSGCARRTQMKARSWCLSH